MSENFNDLGNENELYSCDSGKIGIIYFYHKFVKIHYTVFQREIEDKTCKNKFKLIYAKYSFIEDESNNIVLPKDEFKDRQFVTPLFITSSNNIQKNYPLINKVAATGMYTCKVFEYTNQTSGDYNYDLDKYYSKLKAEEKEKNVANSQISGAGQYYFIGEFMDKMWPFEGWETDIPYEEDARVKFIPWYNDEEGNDFFNPLP